MATNEHLLVKPEKLAATAVGVLEQELIVPNLFQKEGIDQFKGADNDTISVKVEGILPFRDYEWRSGSEGSSTPGTRASIVFDQYSERKIAVTFGGNVYSAVRLTDEQYDFDLDGWGKLLTPQAKAVARGLNRRAISTLTSQSYPVVIGDAKANLRGALIEARRVLNAFNVPDEQRYLLVGTDFEAALLTDAGLNLAQNVGDSEAESALTNATIGRRFGFNIVVDQTIPAGSAYAFASSAFIFLSGAPAVPNSVGFGSTASYEGTALRWLRDYDPVTFQDRSVVNTYAGFRSVTDILLGWNNNNSEVVGGYEHFVRGVRLDLDGASTYPVLKQKDGTTDTTWANYNPAGVGAAGTPASAELALFSGITGPGAHLAGTPTGTVAND